MEIGWRPRRLIICGDSFNIGIGCMDLDTEPYGVLLARHFDIPLINLAKGSSTNLSIWLQVEHAVNELQAGPDDLVLVNETSSNRFNWFPDNHVTSGPIKNFDVNYHQYPPYGNDSYHHILSEHPMQDDPRYVGKMYTENIAGVIDYYDNFLAKGYNQQGRYYDRLTKEPPAKLKLMMDFYASVYDENISQLQSKAFMVMCYTLLKQRNINHLMLLANTHFYNNIIDEQYLTHLHWGEITLQYPDNIPSGHADERGHCLAKDIIMEKLIKNKWA